MFTESGLLKLISNGLDDIAWNYMFYLTYQNYWIIELNRNRNQLYVYPFAFVTLMLKINTAVVLKLLTL